MPGSIEKLPCRIWIQQTMRRRGSGSGGGAEMRGIRKKKSEEMVLGTDDEATGRGQSSRRSRGSGRG